MTSAQEWQSRVGEAWAENWRATDRSLAGVTARLLARISELPSESILDIGCGAGELSLALARARPVREIIGLDISPALVAAARERAGERGRVRFELGDAARWSEAGFAPDLLVSRHGVMFFDDPVGAFRHLASIAVPGAKLAFSCFARASDNPWAMELAALLAPAPPADPAAPGPFAFGDPARVRAILAEAGWRMSEPEPVDFAFVAGTGADAQDEARAFLQRIGPVARRLAELEGAQRDAALERLDRLIAQRTAHGVVAFGAAAWVINAHRA